MFRRLLPLLFLIFVACTHSRLVRYEELLEPMVGNAKKTDVNAKLGRPVQCKKVEPWELCEYRTAAERNDPVPEVAKKVPGMGPDVSPTEYFDELHLYFDDFGTLRDWKPGALAPR